VDTTDLTREELAALLKETERAHGQYEADIGERDENWPLWYAGYILDRLNER
jgi:hypothetical protein